MRRRAPEFLRRQQRRGFLNWIWWLVGFFTFAGLMLFVVHHRNLDRFGHAMLEKGPPFKGLKLGNSNFTVEILSSTSFTRQLADQMTLAKAYVIIAKEHGNHQLVWELSSLIRKCLRLISRAAMTGKRITLEDAHPVVSRLSQLIYKAQDSNYDIATTIVTLKRHTQALEERADSAIAQSVDFGKIAAESLPKGLHCLNVKLTEESFRNPGHRKYERRDSHRIFDNDLYHFCIFSDNVLATAVVVNSSISESEQPQKLVFHVVTDGVNYRSMKTWFRMTDLKGSTVEVKTVDEFSWLNASYSPLVRRLSDPKTEDPKSETLLNHLRFYVAGMFPSLKKVIFLDDEVVVQKDLTPLLSIDLHGNVNGAVETCLESFHRFYKYLNFSNLVISSKFDPQACGWAFGVNVFDLVAWRRDDVTSRYHYWIERNADSTLWKSGILPAGLLTFYGMTEPLDRRWHVLGLGHDTDINARLIESAAVVHFNGHMKPWMKLGIARYKLIWERYLDLTNPYLRECLVNPGGS